MQFGGRYGFGSVSVRIRCICETALRASPKFLEKARLLPCTVIMSSHARSQGRNSAVTYLQKDRLVTSSLEENRQDKKTVVSLLEIGIM